MMAGRGKNYAYWELGCIEDYLDKYDGDLKRYEIANKLYFDHMPHRTPLSIQVKMRRLRPKWKVRHRKVASKRTKKPPAKKKQGGSWLGGLLIRTGKALGGK